MNYAFAGLMTSFEGYTIGKMLKYLVDPDIISFAGGLPSTELFPVDFIREAAEKSIRESYHKVLQYSPILGEKDLLDAIIDYLKTDGIVIGPENIMITSSGQHGLDLLGRLFLDPQDLIVCDLPTFGGALAAFELEDAKYIARDIQEDGTDIEMLGKDIEASINRGKKPKFIYLVPDFQNPSGITMSLKKRLALLDMAKKYEIPIVEDSPYRELRYRGEQIPAIYSLDENQGNVIGVYTFSKILCPGLRVGFNIGSPDVIKKFTFIKGSNTLNTPKLNQDICSTFLREFDLETHFQKARKYYEEKLAFFLGAMEENFPEGTGVTWTKPEGGLFLWMTVPDDINTLDLFHLAIEQKVAFVPGEVCYPAGYRRYNTMRINFSFPTKEQIVEGVKRLSTVIQNYRDKKSG